MSASTQNQALSAVLFETVIQEAIEFHIEGLRHEGRPLPEPTSTSKVVTIDA